MIYLSHNLSSDDRIFSIKDTLFDIKMAIDAYLEHVNLFIDDKCRLCSYFTMVELNKKYPQYEFRCDGGWSDLYEDVIKNNPDYLDMNNFPGGMISAKAYTINSHYWTKSDILDVVIDLSAEQFGYEKILVMPPDEKDAYGHNFYVSNLDPDKIKNELCYSDTILGYYHPREYNKTLSPEQKFHYMIEQMSSFMSGPRPKDYNELKEEFNSDITQLWTGPGFNIK